MSFDGGTDSSQLFWWRDYNEVKHNRIENYEVGKFENLLNSLGSLYFMELYLVRKIGRNTNDRDVPNSISKLFEIKNWETKDTVVGYDTYTMNNDDINELKEICKIQI
ncbi:hypothetical protein [Clostridium beijerinckii]|uniref:hypothetical protein n=1 Tax=Clostridium beijerinckii TaxID=1520 RepID=UPI00098C74E9|nr:hypothetical protein [Clostridium beijerinckii]NRT80063.1 hypothetical protein [Clostridium beijerinckii]OOM48876.1 hypothetical protein CBEIJ_19280 [Clostridium beijerinckii]